MAFAPLKLHRSLNARSFPRSFICGVLSLELSEDSHRLLLGCLLVDGRVIHGIDKATREIANKRAVWQGLRYAVDSHLALDGLGGILHD